MIKSFRSNKLKKFWVKGDVSKVHPGHIDRLDMILTSVEASHHPKDLKAIFGNQFDEKKGNAEGVYSIEVNGQWRVTFEIEDEGAVVVDYVDYHGKKIKKR